MHSALRLFGVVSLGLALTAAAIQPATADRPGKVGQPVIRAASPTSLTISWPRVAGATKYDVSVAATPGKARRAPARTVRTSARPTTWRVSGLKAGTMYCLAVRARKGSSAGTRSEALCKLTPPRRIKPGRPTLSIVTYNICGIAAGCPNWTTARERRLASLIRSAKADVVALQETKGTTDSGTPRLERLAALLSAQGYAQVPQHFSNWVSVSREVIFYRKSKLSLAMARIPQVECDFDSPVPYLGDTTGWSPSDPPHWFGSDYVRWDQELQIWVVQTSRCIDRGSDELFPQGGTWQLDQRDSAAWGILILRSTGKKYFIVSAHLAAGVSDEFSKIRDAQVKDLLRAAADRTEGMPMIIAGDFNSSRNRPVDSPRRRLERSGLFDAYDRSTTFTNAGVASFNGFRSKPTASTRYANHIDRIFVPDSMGVSGWRVLTTIRKGRYVKPIPSDHNPVRVTIHLP